MRRRVVITGMGVISPIGNTVEIFWQNLINGVSGIGEITAFDTSEYTTHIAGEVKDFRPEEYMDKKEAKRMDRFAQFAVAATRMALEQAKLDISAHHPERVGVYIGSGIG